MTEKIYSHLIMIEFEYRERQRRLKEAEEKHAPGLYKKVEVLIKDITIDPLSDSSAKSKRERKDDEVSVSFPFKHRGDEFLVNINRYSYPREGIGFPELYAIRIGDRNENTYFLGEDTLRKDGSPIETHIYKYLFCLIDEIEEGIKSGEIVPIIHSPKPIYGPFLEEAV